MKTKLRVMRVISVGLFAALMLCVAVFSFVACTDASENEEPADEHHWKEATRFTWLGQEPSRKEATCTEDGYIDYECSDFFCSETKREIFPALGHDVFVEEEGVEATCTTEGKEPVSYCTRCGEHFGSGKTIPKLSHELDETTVTHKDPDCTHDGYNKGKCKVCNETINEVLPATGHKKSGNAALIRATCTEDGCSYYFCLTCNAVLEKTVIPKKGHTPGEKEVEKAATCSEEGLETVKCITCGITLESKTLEKKAHTPKKNREITKAATCTEEGIEALLCSVCGEAIESKTIAKLSHTPKSVGEYVAPTCKTQGFMPKSVCSVCGTTLSEAHALQIVAHDYVKGVCSYCKETKRCTVTLLGTTGAVEETKTYLYGETLELADKADSSGRLFDGWYGGGKKWTSGMTVTDDLTLAPRYVNSTPVRDAASLKAIAQNPVGNYHLAADINLGGEVWTPIAEFGGILDGKGYTVKNFSLSSTSPGENFGFIRVNKGTIRNLTFKDVTLNVTHTVTENYTASFGVAVGKNQGELSGVSCSGGKWTANISFSSWWYTFNVYGGTLVGMNDETGTIIDVSSDLEMNYSAQAANGGAYATHPQSYLNISFGGILGYNEGSVTKAYYVGKLTGQVHSSGNSDVVGGNAHAYSNLGGIVGQNGARGHIEKSSASADVSIETMKAYRGNNYTASGVAVGRNYGVLVQSYCGGTVAGFADNETLFGGFVGKNEDGGKIENCYSTARVDATCGGSLGGFVGQNASVIQNCYSLGAASGGGASNIGGFIGYNLSTGTVSKCYSMGNVTAFEGNDGYFVGATAGVLFKCYYVDGVWRKKNGSWVSGAENKDVLTVTCAELWSETFLNEDLYWDGDVWLIVADDHPLLYWELDMGHEFKTETVAPDCTHGGFTVYDCAHCGRTFIKDYTEPKGHDYVASEVVEPTCTGEGYTIEVCSRCGDERHVDTVPATGHPRESSTIKSDDKKATCTQDGYILWHCDKCNSNYIERQTALGHDGEFIRTEKAPTCHSEGEDLYLCLRCVEEYSVTTERLPHTLEEVERKAPSCGVRIDPETEEKSWDDTDPENFGYSAHLKCTNDGCDYTEGKTVIYPHEFELVKVIEAATCTHAGRGEFACKLLGCGKTEEREIPMAEHVDANGDYICDTCGRMTFVTGDVEIEFTHIKTAQELASIANDLNGNYWLDVDLDLSGIKWTPLGAKDTPFRGLFYGGNHSITGLNFNINGTPGEHDLGLFAYNAGKIYSLHIGNVSATITNADCVFGAYAAHNTGMLVNCTLYGSIEIKANLTTAVSNFTAVTARQTCIFGGIAGENGIGGVIDHCTMTGSINATYDNSAAITAEPDRSLWNKFIDSFKKIIYETSCVNEMNVTFGGVVGVNSGTLSHTEVTGNIVGAGTIKARFAMNKGEINGIINEYAGSLVGYNTGSVTNCAARAMSLDAKIEWNNLNLLINAPAVVSKTFVYRYSYTRHTAENLYGIVGKTEKPIIVG